MPNAKDVITEAKKHIGYVEGPKKTNMFGKWYGADRQAWCAMFVSYVFYKAGANHLIRGAQTSKGFSSCGAGIRYFKKKNAWYKVNQSQPGDLAFFDWNGDGIQDHVGIIIKNDKDKKQVLTVEGNTNDGNSSNGGHTVSKWRSYKYIIGVGRPAYDIEPVPVPEPVAETVTPVETKPAPTKRTTKPKTESAV